MSVFVDRAETDIHNVDGMCSELILSSNVVIGEEWSGPAIHSYVGSVSPWIDEGKH